MKTKYIVLTFLVSMFVFGSIFVFYEQQRVSSAAVPDPPTEIPAGHKAPTREWLRDYYQELLPAREEIRRIRIEAGLQEKEDRLRGLESRMYREMDGANFYFNEATRTHAPRPKALASTPERPLPGASGSDQAAKQ